MANNTSSVGYRNPYSDRGYRYDTETGLYYLQSRYYNPEWGRFINADTLIVQTEELLGHNMVAYTRNNSVNMSGNRPKGILSEHLPGKYINKSNKIDVIILVMSKC